MSALDHVLTRGRAAGILSAQVDTESQQDRPWPVVILTTFGAWLAAVPFIAMAFELIGNVHNNQVLATMIGALTIIAAVMVLRPRGLPLFVEQLGIPALLTGCGVLGEGLSAILEPAGTLSTMAIVMAACAAAIPRAWLRVPLGAAAAVLAFAALTPFDRLSARSWEWIWWHLLWGGWVIVSSVITPNLAKDGRGARFAVMLEPFTTGWCITVLIGLCVWSGESYVLSALQTTRQQATDLFPAMPFLPPLFACAAAALLLWRWPGMRRVDVAVAAIVLVALSYFMPALGAALLTIALCLTSNRWPLAAAASVAAVWIIGFFYYQLEWSLAHKAAILVGAAGALGLGLLVSPHRLQFTPHVAAPAAPRARWWLVLSLLATLGVINAGIWQREDLIRRGDAWFVQLAPVDPRSLMQGDYMALRFAVPGPISSPADNRWWLGGRRPFAVARRDERGIATMLRVHDGSSPLADGEHLVELTPSHGTWTIASDAWYFKEGEAARWAKARYGEFRIDHNGHALLVGLRGKDLEPL